MNKKDIDILEGLLHIDIDKEKINIFCNARSFFLKELEKISDPTIRKMFKVNVFFTLKKVSMAIDNQEDDLKIVNKTKTMLNFVKISREFYLYALESLRFIIQEQDDMILDSYNENKIDKNQMSRYIKLSQERKSGYIEEEKDLVQSIEDLDKMIKDITEYNL